MHIGYATRKTYSGRGQNILHFRKRGGKKNKTNTMAIATVAPTSLHLHRVLMERFFPPWRVRIWFCFHNNCSLYDPAQRPEVSVQKSEITCRGNSINSWLLLRPGLTLFLWFWHPTGRGLMRNWCTYGCTYSTWYTSVVRGKSLQLDRWTSLCVSDYFQGCFTGQVQFPNYHLTR